ncbi:MAG TPA: glycosyltransferase [Actinophytocola sp.]|nr:glycosyltransferase [Actinophytocola sp.]
MGPPLTRKLRVVTLLDRLRVGGAERFAVGLANNLDPERFDSILCTTRPDEDTYEELDLAGGPLRRLALDRSSRAALGSWSPLIRLIRTERVDVLHAHMHGSNIWAAVLGRALRVPVVIATEHSWSFQGRPLRKGLDRHVVGRFCDAFAAISAADRTRMIEVVGVPAERVPLMPLGLIPRAERPYGRLLRTELGIPPDAPVVSTLCMLRPQKALDVLIRAFREVVAEHREARLLIAGEGEERGLLEATIAETGLGSSVVLLGLVTDVGRVLRATDVYAQSSDWEGTPIVMLEAMSAGLPVVSTAVGGVPALLGDSCGLLVPPRDPVALGQAINKLLADPNARGEMGAAGRAQIAADYGFDHTVEAWQNLYTQLYARSRRGAR